MTRSPQLEFWKGEFGDNYIDRNAPTSKAVSRRVMLWASILKEIAGQEINGILEVGPSIGLNLRALRTLTQARLLAVEPNAKARQCLLDDGVVAIGDVMEGSATAIPFESDCVDLAFTSGVLIHINPDELNTSCAEIYRCTRKWIVCIEYFAAEPEEKSYRGHLDRLFKRDFGAYWMDNFPDLRCLSYGFAWKRMTGLDDVTWWLFEKSNV